MSRVVVIGAGIAGTTAALTLRARGADVSIVVGPAGATHLASGMLDGEARAEVLHALAPLLDAYAIESAPSLVATSAGMARIARGRDRALLDFSRLTPGEVLIPRAPRGAWDADAIAKMLGAHPRVREHRLDVRAVDATLLRLADERVIPDATIAARHDDTERLEWLVDRLRPVVRASPSAVAVLLPPWLGCDRERATDLSARLGVAVGEIAVGLAGPAGFRFANARDRAFTARGIEAVTGFVTRFQADASGVHVTLDDERALHGDFAVLATGGVVGGGLVYAPSDTTEGPELPADPRPYLREALASFGVGVRGRPLDTPGTLFGVAPETIAWPFAEHGDLERAGVLLDATHGHVLGAPRVFACGDVVADVPRRWLDAAASGHAAALAITPSADAASRG